MTYLYHFEHVRQDEQFVTHFSEVPFVFHWEYIGFNSTSDQDMADVLTSYWGNSMLDTETLHSPSSDIVGLSGLPVWTPFSYGTNETILLPNRTSISVVGGIKISECAFMIPRLDIAIRGDFPPK